MNEYSHVYSTRTITLGGLVEITLESMWSGSLHITMTIYATGEIREVDEADLRKLGFLLDHATKDCDYVGS